MTQIIREHFWACWSLVLILGGAALATIDHVMSAWVHNRRMR